jgi:uncharacterized membrane protein
MITETPTESQESRGGTGLMLIVSAATVVTIILEALFVAWGSWTLLPAMVLFILVLAGTVVGAVAHLIDS